MEIKFNNPPREFGVGVEGKITIKDMGEIQLSHNEMVTFITDQGSRYDFAQKDWGFYATPSINGRLKTEGFKTALVQNNFGRIYVMVVEEKKIQYFEDYCEKENQKVLTWLDECSSLNINF